jgi:type I restriction-modification system DNA methylase subunit
LPLGQLLIAHGDTLAGVILITADSGKKRLVYDEVELISNITTVASIAIKNARMYEKACIEARTDEMTGLLNRKYFHEVLYEEFEKAKGNAKKLNLLHLRLQNLKIFDPACGSGNFLIIAYKELRKLEMLIFKEGGLLISPSIKLTQFYGIELDDFAHEVAILSLWLAEHQMNVLFKKEFGTVPPALPLQDGGNIVHGNATRLDWKKVCPKNIIDEIYILGNPPYLGSRNQNKEQKEDMKMVFTKDYKSLDYIACWFYLGAEYIRGINAKCAFVSTNSISQGEQVSLTWPRVLKNDLEICFTHQSFKWQNNAKSNANVIVVIIGLSNISNKIKYIFNKNIKQEVQNISPYLTNGNTVYVTRKSKSISKFPEMKYGNMPNDNGNLILSTIEKNKLIEKSSNADKFIKKFIGAADFIRGNERYCLWISDSDIEEAIQIEDIKKRLEGVTLHREQSTEKSTREKATTPNQFYFTSHEKTDSILIPRHSSENRKYIPIGLFNDSTIIADSAMAVYNASPWLFGLITSNMHMVWMKAVGGKLKTDYRYSTSIIYNTFPFPVITEKQKENIIELVFYILDEREQHSEKTLAQMYDPDKMPKGLEEAHHQLDLAIEKCYRNKPFENDEERLEYLFKLYEEMTNKGMA